MKINEVEALVGITKKNIRFYEQEGLLNPSRNLENGYRNYSGEDAAVLRRIKLMRKLGVPLEEIRRMQAGELTVPDAMGRHMITLERESRKLEHAREMCARLREGPPRLAELDTEAYLAEMERMEQEGASFLDRQKQDARMRYVAPVAVSLVFIALMAGLIGLMLWSFSLDPDEAPPLALTVVLVAMPAAVILGVVLALIQRIREIGKGEIEDAKHY